MEEKARRVFSGPPLGSRENSWSSTCTEASAQSLSKHQHFKVGENLAAEARCIFLMLIHLRFCKDVKLVL